jgi:hypothetical protein
MRRLCRQRGPSRTPSVTAACQAPRLHTLEHLRIWRPFDLEITGRALLQPAEAMIDEDVSPRYLRLEFNHCCSTRWDQRRLYVAQRLRRAFGVDLVKNLTNDMKARDRVRPGIAKKDSYGFANLGLQSPFLRHPQTGIGTWSGVMTVPPFQNAQA